MDAAIDLLPRQFGPSVCRAAIRAGTHVVNTNYAYDIADLDEAARTAGVAIMPECGLDPGIDLVLYGMAREKFSELHLVNSYCGGLPEARAANNPLKYKVSWNWEGGPELFQNGMPGQSWTVRSLTSRAPCSMIPCTSIRSVSPAWESWKPSPTANAIFFYRPDRCNGDGPGKPVATPLRWPGWSAFWHPLKQLGFLDETPVPGLPEDATPYRMMVNLLAPQLQYGDDEKDLVAMLNVFEGLVGTVPMRMTAVLLIERDLDTGLMAMAKGVGYPASIVAQMIVRGDITARGVLTPTRHVPVLPFYRTAWRAGPQCRRDRRAPAHE